MVQVGSLLRLLADAAGVGRTKGVQDPLPGWLTRVAGGLGASSRELSSGHFHVLKTQQLSFSSMSHLRPRTWPSWSNLTPLVSEFTPHHFLFIFILLCLRADP